MKIDTSIRIKLIKKILISLALVEVALLIYNEIASAQVRKTILPYLTASHINLQTPKPDARGVA